MSSVEGVGKPLPPMTSNGTTGSVSTGAPYANAEFMIEVSDTTPTPAPANSEKPSHRKLRPVIVTPGRSYPQRRIVGYTRRLAAARQRATHFYASGGTASKSLTSRRTSTDEVPNGTLMSSTQ